MKFARELDELLIGMIEKNPHFYDRRCQNYQNHVLMQKTWKNIADTLNVNVEAAKLRWKTLRDSFVKEFRSISNNSKLRGNVSPYYDKMLWLIPHIRKRNFTWLLRNQDRSEENLATSGALNTGSDESSKKFKSWKCADDSIQLDEISEDPLLDGVYLPRNEERLVGTSSGYSPGDQQPETRSDSSLNFIYTNSNKTLSEQEMNNSFQQFEQKIIDTLSKNEDPDLNFVKSVAKDMKLISDINKVNFKRDLMNLLATYIENEKK